MDRAASEFASKPVLVEHGDAGGRVAIGNVKDAWIDPMDRAMYGTLLLGAGGGDDSSAAAGYVRDVLSLHEHWQQPPGLSVCVDVVVNDRTGEIVARCPREVSVVAKGALADTDVLCVASSSFCGNNATQNDAPAADSENVAAGAFGLLL